MRFLHGILANHFFIIKELQRNKLKKFSSFLNGKILDIGCGTKPYKELITHARYIGIDQAAELRPDVQSVSQELPFKTNYFDAAVCTEVLEHLKEPEKCLLEINRVLKKGGHVYITVPQNWGLHYEPHDYWRFTKYSMEYLVKKSGFEIIQIEEFGGFLSLTGQELIDIIWVRLVKILSFLGLKWAERVSSVLCSGISLVCYILGAIGDNIDKRFAIGLAVICKKS